MKMTWDAYEVAYRESARYKDAVLSQPAHARTLPSRTAFRPRRLMEQLASRLLIRNCFQD